jgi:hypothetical protein
MKQHRTVEHASLVAKVDFSDCRRPIYSKEPYPSEFYAVCPKNKTCCSELLFNKFNLFFIANCGADFVVPLHIIFCLGTSELLDITNKQTRTVRNVCVHITPNLLCDY